ncbi:MAG: immune inhibitor A, partial [Thermoplasmatales archaeon]|nr:immune inhibitor A [Thermoplasmatales archaeon]
MLEEIKQGNMINPVDNILSSERTLTTIITDQNEGVSVDIKQVDAGYDKTNIEFRVELYTSLLERVGYLWLDTDQDPSTGATESDWPGYGLNDIGADYVVLLMPDYPGYEGAYLYMWTGYEFEYAAYFPITATTYEFEFSMPLSYLNDDGIMDVTLCLGDYYALTDIAPDTGHGTTGVSIDWLSISPTGGTVNGGSQTNITLTINATELEVGTYNATIIVTSNDPDESTITIPVHLTVQPPEHDIAVTNIETPSPTEVNHTTYINATIENKGLNDESNVVINLLMNGAVVNTTSITSINSGETKNVNFTWTPTSVGNYTVGIYAEPVFNETVVINNMLETIVIVEAYSDIWVTPAEFNITVTQGTMYNETLIIGNDGTGVLEFNITDTVVESGVLFSDNMENGVNGWTHGGSYDEWELGTPTYGPSDTHSGVNCWGTDLDGNYNNYCDQWLMSPSIDLSTSTYVTFSFWCWAELEGYYDYAYVEISGDGGSTWSTLDYWDSDYYSWTEKIYNISSYAGLSDVRIRFRLDSDGSVTYAGLYIDDVNISVTGEFVSDWLTVSPTSGSINIGDQIAITLTINATGLDNGTYNATISIMSNDPDEGAITISVTLEVVPNQLPIANAGVDKEFISEQDILNFSAFGSYDPDPDGEI